MRRSLDRACIVRIERYLRFYELVSIAEWAERRGIPLDTWVEYSGALAWIDLAVGRAADEAIRTNAATSRSDAMRQVCARFGLDGDNLRRRWEKTRADSLRRRRAQRRAHSGGDSPLDRRHSSVVV